MLTQEIYEALEKDCQEIIKGYYENSPHVDFFTYKKPIDHNTKFLILALLAEARVKYWYMIGIEKEAIKKPVVFRNPDLRCTQRISLKRNIPLDASRLFNILEHFKITNLYSISKAKIKVIIQIPDELPISREYVTYDDTRTIFSDTPLVIGPGVQVYILSDCDLSIDLTGIVFSGRPIEPGATIIEYFRTHGFYVD
jgi:hypothetical protein